MNLVSFIFFGTEAELDSTILKKLKIVEYRPVVDGFKGLYAIEKKYGQEDIRKIDLGFNTESESDWLIYRYLSVDELVAIQLNSINKRIYVLMHNYYSYDFLMAEAILKNREDQLIYVVDSANDEFKTSDFVTKRIKTKNIFQLQKSAVKKKNESKDELKNNFLVYWVGIVIKAILNPTQELSRFLALLRYSNLRILGRSLELVLFIHFIVKILLLVPLQVAFIKIYHSLIWLGGWFKVILIKLGYLIRHLLLMMGFKSFGAFIDSTNFVIRAKDFFIKWSYYNFLHRLYYDYIRAFFIRIFELLTKVYFDYVHKAYFKTVHAFYYRFVHRFYFEILHNFYHKVLKKIFDYIWVNFLSKFIFDFLVKQVYYGVIFKIYYSIFFTFYHKVLKKIFTSLFFGFIQPLYYAVVVNFLYYGILHKFYHTVLVNFLYYGVIHNFYHKVLVKLYVFVKYKIIFSLYFGVLYPGYHLMLNFIRYKIRHWLLVSYYKLYGFLFDCCTFTYRVFKLYLMYPFFKVYWFTRFQFNKRIKKKITNE